MIPTDSLYSLLKVPEILRHAHVDRDHGGLQQNRAYQMCRGLHRFGDHGIEHVSLCAGKQVVGACAASPTAAPSSLSSIDKQVKPTTPADCVG
jgi:hypothetical protein